MSMLTKLLVTSVHLFAVTTLTAGEGDWPGWRGPNTDGVAPEAAAPPTRWDTTENILWKAPVPGRGHSSPIVVGDRVILTTADEATGTQSVLCYDRGTGKQQWNTPVNKGGLPDRIHSKNTHASPTPVSDGERVFAVFNHHNVVHLIALTLDGKGIWQKRAGGYDPRRYKYGYAPSPIIHESLVIVTAEAEAESFVAAFDRATGKEIWRIQRPRNISYSTPAIATVAGKEQLFLSGADQIASYDPRTGLRLWTTPGVATATCGTAVWTDNIIVASGGYPQRETLAVKGDGSGSVVWRNRVKCYEQSMLIHKGYVYAFDDGGMAHCWSVVDGEDKWGGGQRLGGPVSASPLLAGRHLYFCNERGKTFVVKADPERFQLVATNETGDELFASPAVSDGYLFLRAADRRSGSRQEYLYCIGTKSP